MILDKTFRAGLLFWAGVSFKGKTLKQAEKVLFCSEASNVFHDFVLQNKVFLTNKNKSSK